MAAGTNGGPLDALLGNVWNDGAELELGGGLDFREGVTAEWDPAVKRVVVKIKPGTTRDVLSFGAVGGGLTSDQAALVNAVAWAYDNDAELYWPGLVFLSTATIPNFHKVRHRGLGVVQRGSDLFVVSPSWGDTNRVYVDAAGNANNDGLSAAQPMRGYQNAIDALKNYGPVLEGTWEVRFAAGTYSTVTTDFGTTQVGIRSRNPILFKGADVGGYPNVPTTVIQGSGAQGWAFTRYMNVHVQDVKFTSFSTGQAVLASYHTRLECTNVHGFGNRNDVYVTNQCYVRFNSGILDGNNLSSASAGVLTIIACSHQVGTTGGSAGDVVIQNHGSGVGFYESSSGHCNATSQDCVYGARADSAGRGNFDTSNFKRCTIAAVRLGANAQAYGLENCVFNTGGADANTRNVIVGGGAMDASMDENTSTPRVYECSQTAVTHTGTTAETLLWSFRAFPSRRFPHTFTVSKRVLMCIMGRLTGTAGTKRIRVRLHNTNALTGTSDGVTGGRVIADITIASGTTPDFEFNLRASFGLASQRTFAKLFTGTVTPLGGLTRFSVATSNGDDWWLNVSVELGNAADTLIMDHRDLDIAG